MVLIFEQIFVKMLKNKALLMTAFIHGARDIINEEFVFTALEMLDG